MKQLVRAAGVAAFALLFWAHGQSDPVWSPRVLLDVIDEETGRPTAARFSLLVDGQAHAPLWIGPHGLRFVSVHISKRQSFVATYARGTGRVEVPLRPGAKLVEVK